MTDSPVSKYRIDHDSNSMRELYTIHGDETTYTFTYLYDLNTMIVLDELKQIPEKDGKNDYCAAMATYEMNKDNIFELKSLVVSQEQGLDFPKTRKDVFDNELYNKRTFYEIMDQSLQLCVMARHILNEELIRHSLLSMLIHSDYIEPAGFEHFGLQQKLDKKISAHRKAQL